MDTKILKPIMLRPGVEAALKEAPNRIRYNCSRKFFLFRAEQLIFEVSVNVWKGSLHTSQTRFMVMYLILM